MNDLLLFLHIDILINDSEFIIRRKFASSNSILIKPQFVLLPELSYDAVATGATSMTKCEFNFVIE